VTDALRGGSLAGWRRKVAGQIQPSFHAARDDSSDVPVSWRGRSRYDELGVGEARAALSEGDETRIKAVRSYERKHNLRKCQAAILKAEPNRPNLRAVTVRDG
jgi:hypothetical protein